MTFLTLSMIVVDPHKLMDIHLAGVHNCYLLITLDVVYIWRLCCRCASKTSASTHRTALITAAARTPRVRSTPGVSVTVRLAGLGTNVEQASRPPSEPTSSSVTWQHLVAFVADYTRSEIPVQQCSSMTLT